MRVRVLTVLLSLSIASSLLSAADAKWVHATSTHFDLYTSESEGDARAALAHLEAVRAYFIASTHVHDPGGKAVRIVAFHSGGDYERYKPSDVHTSKAFGKAPGSIAVQGLKADVYDQIFREYAELALGDSAPALPYWFRSGFATVYSTVKPTDAGMNLGAAPRSNFRNGEVGDVSLELLFDANREAILASREKASDDFNASRVNTGSENGAKAGVGSREPGGAAATALQSVESTMNASQDFARASWMLVHMLMFQQEYRPKFGAFLGAISTGTPTAAAFSKVYGAPISKVHADLVIYAKQTGLMVMSVPYHPEKAAAPQIGPAAKEDVDRVLAELK